MIRAFSELTAEQQPLAGGKGGTLGRLYQAGYPVPDGFVILPAAFEGDTLRLEAWQQVLAKLDHMRQAENGMAAFAVRSSALSEDSAFASFAGEFETVLDVHSNDMIRAAIQTVRRSRHAERVRAYSQAKGIDAAHNMAVVVQRLVRADISGVLFTADPVSGSRNHMTGNFVFGFGKELVSGEAEPYTFTFKQPKGQYEGPSELQPFASRLFTLARRLEKDLRVPQDIEWAVAGNKLFLLQSRPITMLVGNDPATGEWNTTFTGDYVWTSVMNAEIFPAAATPSTWSVWQVIFDRLSLGHEYPVFGNIAGRFYANYSVMYSFMIKIMRKHERVMAVLEKNIARLPPEISDIPQYPIPLKSLLGLVVREMRNQATKKRLKRNRAEFLTATADRCWALRRQIRNVEDGTTLVALWHEEIKPFLIEAFTLQDGLNEDFAFQNSGLRSNLLKHLGEEEANTVLSTVTSGSAQMASVGLLLGLSQLDRGEINQSEYLRRHGHRGPYENYSYFPRPYEDPEWLDERLAEFRQSPASMQERLAERNAEFDALWERIGPRLGPKRAKEARHKIEEMIQTCLAREEARSELTRVVGVARDIFLRASELLGLGDSVFFLAIDELCGLLSGDWKAQTSLAYIPARRETYEQNKALPPLPIWIRGRFDPFQWAADPSRRTDVFDARAPLPALETVDRIEGNAGSAGQVEGLVRRIDSPEEGQQLLPGEVLVTSTTNIGWTPLFPRAAAVVTDIGGALSHAAIVAREIGIPAVVGCGDATMRLVTGDRVRVDGGQGIVEILDSRKIRTEM